MGYIDSQPKGKTEIPDIISVLPQISEGGNKIMVTVLVVAQCKDPRKWEESFVAHGPLFRTMGATGPAHYGLDGNSAAVLMDMKDLDHFDKMMSSQAIADAMAADGVLRETARLFVLDKKVVV